MDFNFSLLKWEKMSSTMLSGVLMTNISI